MSEVSTRQPASGRRRIPTEVYVMVRVSYGSDQSPEAEPTIRFCPNPWKMIYDGDLYHLDGVELALGDERPRDGPVV